MMRSLFSGVSGLRNHQIRMDVIGNNIANVNTIGYKGSRVTFRDLLYQTMSGSAAPQGNRGGINPQQVGLGVGVGSIDMLNTQGSTETTGMNTDMMIDGDGFFILQDGSKNYYTRAGAFGLDYTGNLVSKTGLKVAGWMANNGVLDPTTMTTANLTGIVIQKGMEMAPQASTTLTYTGNLDARLTTIGDSRSFNFTVYDSLGNSHDLVMTFTRQAVGATNTWGWEAFAGATSLGTGTVNFNSSGAWTSSTGGPINYNPGGGAAAMAITPDFSAMTQYAAESSGVGTANGYTRGSLQDFSLDAGGVVTGMFSNGRNQPIAQVAMSVFNNPGGLTRKGDTLFEESNNSGVAQVGIAQTGGRGKITPGSVEMSNVDLSQEFTNMIVTQRGFQANSRIITTSDEMLQELVNLKR